MRAFVLAATALFGFAVLAHASDIARLPAAMIQGPLLPSQIPAPVVYSFAGDGTTTTFALSPAVDPTKLSVSISGVPQSGWTATSSSITFPAPPPPGSNVVVVYGGVSASLPGLAASAYTDTTNPSNIPFSVNRSILSKLKDFQSIRDGVPGVAAGAVGDGVTDDAPAIQAMINACSICYLVTPQTPTGYRLATPITGKAGVHFIGQSSASNNIHADPQPGSVFFADQTTGPMFTFPGSSSLTSNADTSWSFEAMALRGNYVIPLISAPEANPGRGAWSAVIRNSVLDKGHPAIFADNGWDWWVDHTAFNRCGNAAGTAPGSDLGASCLQIHNSAQTYAGAASNSWRITDNTFDITGGRGVISDASGAGIPPTLMTIAGNHFGPTGYDSIYGCFSGSGITNNVSEGSVAGYPIFNFFAPGGRNSCGSNRITNNTLNTPGTVAIMEGQAADLIADNVMQGTPSLGGFVQLPAASFTNIIINNKTVPAGGTPTTPIIAGADLGSGNTVRDNDSSDNVVANGEQPSRQAGAPLWASLSPQSGIGTYVPTITCGSGTITTLGSVYGRYKQLGKMVYVSVNIPITTNGSCATNIQFSLPRLPADYGSIPGRELAGAVSLTASFANNSYSAYLNKYDGSYAGFNGATLTVNGWYQGQ